MSRYSELLISKGRATAKRSWLKVALVGASLLILLLGLTAIAFYKYTEKSAYSETMRRGLPKKNYNSIKHAFAATKAYSFARALWLDDDEARWITTHLGYANEWAERHFPRFRKPDSTGEIYKDLCSNLSGIIVVRWLEESGYRSSGNGLRLIGWLSQRGVIVATADDQRIPRFSSEQDLALAIDRFQQDAAALQVDLTRFLNDHRSEIEQELR